MSRIPTDRLLTLGMALYADKRIMERRVRGVFARGRSTRLARALSLAFMLIVFIACFTTACRSAQTRRASVSYTDSAGAPRTVVLSSVNGGEETFTLADAAGREATFTLRHSEGMPPNAKKAAVLTADALLNVFGDAVSDATIYVEETARGAYRALIGSEDEGKAAFWGVVDREAEQTLQVSRSDRGLGLRRMPADEIKAYDWADFQPAYEQDMVEFAAALVKRCFAGEREIVMGQDGSCFCGAEGGFQEPNNWHVVCAVRMDEGACYAVEFFYPSGAITGVWVCPLGWEQAKSGQF